MIDPECKHSDNKTLFGGTTTRNKADQKNQTNDDVEQTA